MKMTYTASLTDCRGINDADRREAEALFADAADAASGGEAATAHAYEAYMDAVNANGGTPLPADATDAQRAAVALWEKIENAGMCAAFAGWYRFPDGAHFEISVSDQ